MSSFHPFEVPIGAPVEIQSDGSIKFQNDLRNIPDDFVEIIHDLHDIDIQATKFWRFTPYDEMVRKSERYESKGVLFLASHPIEWINKNQINTRDPINWFLEFRRVPGVDWYDRYSIGISDPRLVGEPEPDRQPLTIKARCMCGKEGLNNETCDVCRYKFTNFRDLEHQENGPAIKRLSKFRQVNIGSTKNGLKWKGSDHGTGLKEALSNDQDIARLVRDVGVLEIHSFSQKYQGWVIEGGRHYREITNSSAYWRMLNKIAQRLLEVDITALISPDGKDVDEDAAGEDSWGVMGVSFTLIIALFLLFHIFIPAPSSTAPAWVGDDRWGYAFFLFVTPLCLTAIFIAMFLFNPFVPNRLWRSLGRFWIRLGIKSKQAKLVGLSLPIYLFLANFDWLPIPLIEGA